MLLRYGAKMALKRHKHKEVRKEERKKEERKKRYWGRLRTIEFKMANPSWSVAFEDTSFWKIPRIPSTLPCDTINWGALFK